MASQHGGRSCPPCTLRMTVTEASWLALDAFCRGMQHTLDPKSLILSMPENLFQQKLCKHAMGLDRLAW